MRVSALSSHAKEAKHQESFMNYNPAVPLFFKKDQGNILCTFSGTTKAYDGRIDTMMNSVAYRSCLNINSLLASMFLDSPIAKSFQLSKTKCGYYTALSLAPYYKEKMLQKVKASLAHSILFDESLNHNPQDEQLDVQIHFWEK